MSDRAIWSLAAKRSELGGATKGQIYISKIAIGFVLATVLWLVSLGAADVIVIGSLAVYLTSKVCWYVNTGTAPTAALDELADWICDATLHFGWLFVWWLAHGQWWPAAVQGGLWILTYAHSRE